MKKWILIGLAVVAAILIAGAVRFFAVTPEKIDRAQNKVKPIALDITPKARALQATLDVCKEAAYK